MNSAEPNRGPRWQLVINHRAGSLDAAVAQARRRNLLASFGILSLLAGSVVIVIIISRRAQKLARKQMDFIAGVSHEFRTPLAVIHAISENLADGLITEQQQIEQCGVVIRNDTRRLAGMVEQVLEFAGASRGKNLYQPQPVDVKEMIEQALSANPILEAQKGWQVEREIEADVPPVLADRAALASAVRNIIDNAVKYGGERHWIGIKAKQRSDDHASTVEITIADRGIGIRESDLSHKFEPFYRGREVVEAQVHGNGLGLSLVKNIIEAHGGTIAVSSVHGEGTAFRLSLPAASVKR
ncbi:MAG TPA: HAMP domain-containing sensor histidine kinase [Blastocatellia bacterium]|nr:HAMP domain-containing sensor histidine kinase [Blastocatellia bacterium]